MAHWLSQLTALVRRSDTTEDTAICLDGEMTDQHQELTVDRALRQAYESLCTAASLNVTAHGARSARVMGTAFDEAFIAIETLIELRAGNAAREI